MKIYENVIQGSEDWMAIRRGKFTSSVMSDLFMKETTKGYQEAINRVVFERIAGVTPESYTNEYMERGKELEEQARQAYELTAFRKVKLVGFIEMNEWAGGSPDGLVGLDGSLEIKVPKWNTLMEYLLKDEIPKDYIIQIQSNLLFSERKWCDFFVYHPNFKPMLRRVDRDEAMIKSIKGKLDEAIAIAQQRIKLFQVN